MASIIINSDGAAFLQRKSIPQTAMQDGKKR